MFLFGNRLMGAAAASAVAANASSARSKARQTRAGGAELQARMDRAMLACEAMWTLMRDKLGITDENLLARINEIDLSDGKLDGKVRKTPVACPKCNRTIPARMPQCMYCGQPIMQDPFV